MRATTRRVSNSMPFKQPSKAARPSASPLASSKQRTGPKDSGPTDSLLQFLDCLFESPPPTDESLMFVVLSMKKKHLRASICTMLLERAQNAPELPLLVLPTTFEYLVDVTNAILRTSLNADDFYAARLVLAFAMATKNIMGGDDTVKQSLLYNIRSHSLFKTLTFWEHVFSVAYENPKELLRDLGLLIDFSDIINGDTDEVMVQALGVLRTCMSWVFLEEELQSSVLEHVLAIHNLEVGEFSELLSTGDGDGSEDAFGIDWKHVNSESKKLKDHQVALELKSQRRKSALGVRKFLVGAENSGPSADSSTGNHKNVRSALLKGIVQAGGGIGNLDSENIDERAGKTGAGRPAQKSGRVKSKRGSVVVPRKRELSRLLLSNERLVWKLKIRIESTVPDLSLENLPGTLLLSNFCLFFEAWEDRVLEDQFIQKFFEIPVRLIERVERDDKTGSLSIVTKDFRTITFCSYSFSSDSSFIDAFFLLCDRYAFQPFPKMDSLLELPFGMDSAQFFSENYFTFGHKDMTITSDGGFSYDPTEEFRRQGALNGAASMSMSEMPAKELEYLGGRNQALSEPNIKASRGAVLQSRWRTTQLNEDYALCETYPQVLLVPFTIEDDCLVNVAEYRSKHRLPVLTYCHKNGAALLRCAQPMVGVFQKRSRDDELYFQEAGISYIFDARPKASAMGNTMMGKGFEKMSNYSGVQLIFNDIENIHAVRNSLEKLMDIMYRDKGDTNFFSNLENCKWLRHIRQILIASLKVAHCLHEDNETCLVHCSDGWDRTAQMCALAQLILDPYFRTIAGFATLIEKDFLGFGHQVARRSGQGDRNYKDDQRSPVFLQFVDSVWQITRQYPCSFEFNDGFLEAMMDSVYSCRFSTFLFDFDCQRRKCDSVAESSSFWDYAFRRQDKFKNLNYVKRPGTLEPRTHMFQLGIWPYLYRFNRSFQAIETATTWADVRTQKIGILNSEVQKLKQKVKELEIEKKELQDEKVYDKGMFAELLPPPPPPRLSVGALPPPPPPEL